MCVIVDIWRGSQGSYRAGTQTKEEGMCIALVTVIHIIDML